MPPTRTDPATATPWPPSRRTRPAAGPSLCAALALLLAMAPVSAGSPPEHAAAVPAAPAPTAAAAPGASAIDGERLLLDLPPAWEVHDRMTEENLRQVDYAPAATAPRAEDEWLRVESIRQDAPTTPREFLDLLAGDLRRRCPALRDTRVASAPENGYATEVRLFDCPRGPGMGPPLQMLKAIQGEPWLYVIARVSRRADTRPEHVNDERVRIGEWSQFMRGVTLCHLVRPEHPCPRPQAAAAPPPMNPLPPSPLPASPLPANPLPGDPAPAPPAERADHRPEGSR